MTDPGPGKAAAIDASKPKSRWREKLGIRPRSRNRPSNPSQVADQGASSSSSSVNALPLAHGQAPTQTPLLPESASNDPGNGLQAVNSINELWNDAYDDLQTKEPKLIKEYGIVLSKQAQIAKTFTVEQSASKIERSQQITNLLKAKLEEVDQSTWRLRFSDTKVPVKDLMKPVVNTLTLAKDYIGDAVSANPYASLAWTGISLLLPLLLNPSDQAKSLAEGLEYISGLIVQSSMREELYRRRYESDSGQNLVDFQNSHTAYKDSLKELYVRILGFEITSICYYSKHTAFRLGMDIVKWNSWDSLLANIQSKEKAFSEINKVWKDKKYDEECEALSSRLQSIVVDVSGLLRAIENAQKDSQRTMLLDWLSSVDSSKNYNSARSRHADKTGDWLMQKDETFKNWKNSSNSLLWLHGKGSFYYSFNDKLDPDPDTMCCSLIKQLCCRRPNTPRALQNLGPIKERGERPDTESLVDTLIATAHGFSQVFLVIDALDECPLESGHREQLLELLRQIHGAQSENLHIFLTSRKESDIDAAISRLLKLETCFAIDLSVRRDDVNRDIGIYVDKTLAAPKYDFWPSEIKSKAKKSLVDKADGMFQYVVCQFEELAKLGSPGAIFEALEALPKGLDATYDRMLTSIDPNFRKKVFHALNWLAFSLRPLSPEELADVFILDHEQPVPFDESQKLFEPKVVLKYLSGLVILGSENRWGKKRTEIRLAHFSIKEYLVSGRIRDGPASKFYIAETSAHLNISASCLALHLQISETKLVTENKDFPIIWEYAALEWIGHLEKVERSSWSELIIGCAIKALTPAEPIILLLQYITPVLVVLFNL
ncbi:hypothetical protein G7Y89_g7913 [Cudoniella acicularis]|uniref:NWD NACHT-NTPase N-terminal domain-containing protein n=1 Tax=Cudoniella acicularis TaxID=354080 RepID=A0A8H4RHI7_9HELO|nr:hypothetical protein G7Y89_g7913 [Cudoniella acicularis]